MWKHTQFCGPLGAYGTFLTENWQPSSGHSNLLYLLACISCLVPVLPDVHRLHSVLCLPSFPIPPDPSVCWCTAFSTLAVRLRRLVSTQLPLPPIDQARP